MLTIKQTLHNVVEQLSEEQAIRVLEMIQSLSGKTNNSLTLARLASDSRFRLPSQGFRPFKRVVPIRLLGVPASKMLIEDRR